MKAVVLSAVRTPEMVELTDPRPEPGQVVVALDHCGICGSDLHAATSDLYLEGVPMGHEFSGRVVETGADATGWRVGNRVVVNPNGAVCGDCAACRRGQRNLCPAILQNSVGARTPGGLAEYTAVDIHTLHGIPDGMSGADAAWTEPVAVALRVVRRSGVRAGDDAIVFGAGPIGLLVTSSLRSVGAASITVVEPDMTRRTIAAGLGADRVIDPTSEDLGLVFPDAAQAPAFAFDCVGTPQITASALRVIRPLGRLTVVGVARPNLELVTTDLVFKEVDIRGSFIYIDEFSQALVLLAKGVIHVDVLTSDIRPLSSALSAFDDMRSGNGVVKILLSGPATDRA